MIDLSSGSFLLLLAALAAAVGLVETDPNAATYVLGGALLAVWVNERRREQA